jgi:hypothetical protein
MGNKLLITVPVFPPVLTHFFFRFFVGLGWYWLPSLHGEQTVDNSTSVSTRSYFVFAFCGSGVILVVFPSWGTDPWYRS